MGRSLFDTLKMLNLSGIEAGGQIVGHRVFVWIDGPRRDGASFNSRECSQAADWLVEQAVRLYPRSDLAKLWGTIAAAAAAAAQQPR